MNKLVKILISGVIGLALLSSCKKHYSCNTYVKVEKTTLDKSI